MLLCLSLIAAMGSVFAEADDKPATAANRTITERIMPTYLMSEAYKTDLPYYFVEGYDGIPWVELDSWLEQASYLMGELFGDMDLKLTGSSEGEQYMAVRENGAAMLLDFEKDTITFNNYNVFVSSSYAVSMMDTASLMSRSNSSL